MALNSLLCAHVPLRNCSHEWRVCTWPDYSSSFYLYTTSGVPINWIFSSALGGFKVR